MKSLNGITQTTYVSTPINRIGDFNIRLTKVGVTLTAYFEDTPNTWTLLTSTTMTLSPVNYSIGLGAIHPSYSGLAEYRNFQVLPLHPNGTWTSASLDIGGKPLKPGTVTWAAEVPTGTGLQVQCASSADNVTFSDFSGDLSIGGAFSAPVARYVKFRVNMQTNAARTLSPSLDKIILNQDDLEGDLLKADSVKAAPNPARGAKVSLRYGLTQRPQKTSLEIYSVAGRLLFQQDVTAGLGENSFELDASQLASGSYFFRVLAWPQEGGQPAIVTKPFALLR